jgi:hypothetical protein
MGGHGFYLTSIGGGPGAPGVGGASAKKDLVALCQSCHTSASGTFEGAHPPTAPDWAYINGGAVSNDPLVEIRALRDKLVVYFVNSAPQKPLKVVGTWNGTLPVWPASAIEWNRDFTSNSVTFATLPPAQSYWNLQLYLEDRSNGIHNPVFAAEILWDAIANLNAMGGPGTPIDFGGLHGIARP